MKTCLKEKLCTLYRFSANQQTSQVLSYKHLYMEIDVSLHVLSHMINKLFERTYCIICASRLTSYHLFNQHDAEIPSGVIQLIDLVSVNIYCGQASNSHISGLTGACLTEIAGLLTRVLTELECMIVQVLSAVRSRQQQLEKRQLRSRQRDNLVRLIKGYTYNMCTTGCTDIMYSTAITLHETQVVQLLHYM